MKKIKRIAITGGIGAGKSAVTDLLREKGCTVIDADEVAREAARPGEPAMQKLRVEFGDGVFLEDGNLDRPALAKLMFGDPAATAAVNDIFHGDIKERMESLASRFAEKAEGAKESGKPVFLSVPLLYEAEADRMADEVWLVTADEPLRLSRAMARDGVGEADIRARMRHQMPEGEKRARADAVIENNGSLPELRMAVERLLQMMP
ncbi:MAG: dephospho-CoA kinase [Clostridiales Family XIII bacterium]|jgi:dephospho-CoA kinase|nr:dephospho-CoA kinase [Clostridiales Family XIII bacterium]